MIEQELTDNVGPQDHGDSKRKIDVDDGTEKEEENFGTVTAEEVNNKLENVVKHSTTLFNSLDNGIEVVVGQHNIGCLFSNIRSRNTHCHSDISSLDSRGIY